MHVYVSAIVHRWALILYSFQSALVAIQQVLVDAFVKSETMWDFFVEMSPKSDQRVLLTRVLASRRQHCTSNMLRSFLPRVNCHFFFVIGSDTHWGCVHHTIKCSLDCTHSVSLDLHLQYTVNCRLDKQLWCWSTS
jgi:hypothetical protein